MSPEPTDAPATQPKPASSGDNPVHDVYPDTCWYEDPARGVRILTCAHPEGASVRAEQPPGSARSAEALPRPGGGEQT